VAVPLHADADSRLQKLFTTLVTNNTQLKGLTDGFQIVLPTPGLTIEPRLGACDAGEDYVQSLRTLELDTRGTDLKLKEQRLEQEKLETERYAKRVKADQLTAPEDQAGMVRVSLDPETITAIAAAIKPSPPA
jgi:hypothetical protein